MLGLPLYGYVSQSTKTTLHEIALPQPGFDVRAYKEQVLGLPDRGLACPLPRARTADQADQKEGEGPNALRGAHPRVKDGVKKGGVRAEADGDLSAYLGQQIPFNQLVALGALQKNSDGTYTADSANGYTMGASMSPLCNIQAILILDGDIAWDDCSDTPFMYDTARKVVVTYDDTWSLGDKATFAKQNGMAGCFTWSLDQV